MDIMIRNTLAAVLLVSVLAGTVRAQDATEPPTAAEVIQWLEADRFAVRESATASLISAGETSIEPVTEAVLSGGLETVTRGLTVLRELALRDAQLADEVQQSTLNAKTAELAQQALRKIADIRITTAAARASSTLRVIDEIRHDRALILLARLGAHVSGVPEVGVLASAEHYIVFDEQWHGEQSDLRLLTWLAEDAQVHVTFAGKSVTNAWLAPLEETKGLVQLMLSRTQIDDEGLRTVARLKQIRALMLRYNPMTDAGLTIIQESRQQFQGVPLVMLQIFGTKITPDAVAVFETAMTGTKCDYRRGAFLGIGPDLRYRENCVVGRVEPNQAAARAGVREMDIVIKYDGQNVQEFEGLTKLIAENQPGDRVVVKVLREDKELDLEIVLGEWP